MSFWTTIAADAATVETDVVAGAKTILQYVDNVVVTDIVPELEAALQQAISQFGQAVLAGLLNSLNTTGTATSTPLAPTAAT